MLSTTSASFPLTYHVVEVTNGKKKRLLVALGVYFFFVFFKNNRQNANVVFVGLFI
jgi:hypothetical protein